MATHAELVTPERVLYSGEAEFVVMRTDGGEIMFLPNHAPFVAALDICVVRIAPAGSEVPGSSPDSAASRAEGGAEVRAAVHGGFVHVADNRVLVLAGVAELSDEIDVPRAQQALEGSEAAIAAASEEGGGTPAPADEEGEGGILQSPAMLALLDPDNPAVAARRARARLEAAGVLEPASSGG